MELVNFCYCCRKVALVHILLVSRIIEFLPLNSHEWHFYIFLMDVIPLLTFISWCVDGNLKTHMYNADNINIYEKIQRKKAYVLLLFILSYLLFFPKKKNPMIAIFSNLSWYAFSWQFTKYWIIYHFHLFQWWHVSLAFSVCVCLGTNNFCDFYFAKIWYFLLGCRQPQIPK